MEMKQPDPEKVILQATNVRKMGAQFLILSGFEQR
jgi:hypothetical protein